jgi:hypothetical protein
MKQLIQMNEKLQEIWVIFPLCGFARLPQFILGNLEGQKATHWIFGSWFGGNFIFFSTYHNSLLVIFICPGNPICGNLNCAGKCFFYFVLAFVNQTGSMVCEREKIKAFLALKKITQKG